MAERILDNTAVLNGSYGGEVIDPAITSDVSVTLADVLLTKTAEPTTWVSGYLTYTITVDNNGNTEEMTNVVVTDTLDTSMFALDVSSIAVEVDGTVLTIDTEYTVDYTAPELTVTFINPIPADAAATITFRGEKVPVPTP